MNTSPPTQRIFAKYLFNVVHFTISTAGFLLSVVVYCIGAVLPFTKTPKGSAVIRSSTVFSIKSLVREDSAEVVFSLHRSDSREPAQTAPIAVRRRGRKSLHTPTMINVGTPATASLVVLTGESMCSSSPSDIELPSYQDILSAAESYSPTSPESTDMTRKAALAKRMPTIFHKSKKEGESSSHKSSSKPTTPKSARSLSPASVLRAVTKREPSEPADAHGRIPYVPNPESVEMLRTTFVNPLKLKSRRRSPSCSPTSTPQSKTFDLPDVSEPPSSPGTPFSEQPPRPRRRRSLVSYITHAIRPSTQTEESQHGKPSVHRASFSSATSSASSSSASSSRSSRRSLSFSGNASENERGQIKRTQPYGAPYYAAMPVPSPRMQRSSSRKAKTMSVKPITEDSEPSEMSEPSALGLNLGSL